MLIIYYHLRQVAVLQAQENISYDLDLPYRHIWKQVVVEPYLQSKLGANHGDTVIIRPKMLTPFPAVCVISGDSPSYDAGKSIIRLNTECRERISAELGTAVFIEKIEAVSATMIKVEWYIRFIHRDQLEIGLKKKIQTIIPELLFHDLADLPIMVNDRFSMSVSFPDSDKYYEIDIWVREVNPRFPIVKLSEETKIVLK